LAPMWQDWSLQRKGPTDQARHLDRIRDALRERLGDLVTEDAIVSSDGRRVVRVPLKSLEEFKFRFDPWRGDHVGQGTGGTEPGDILGRLPNGRDKGQGEAGDQPGADVYEVEVTVDEVAALLFEDLALPYLEPRGGRRLEEAGPVFRDIRKVGLLGNLDKRRTLKANLMRNARRDPGEPAHVKNLSQDDLRFKTWVEERRDGGSAVVIAMRDVSGSMGDFKKRMTRAFFFWMLKFLRTRYRHVEVVFIVHHTQAREVDEDSFFRLGESGGTKVSSAYELCRDVIRERYAPSRWNIYPFHFSDGDNWSDADNRRTVEILGEMLPWVNAFGYAEIREGGYTSTLMTAFAKVDHPRFRLVTIAEPGDVLKALRRFFHQDAGRTATQRGVSP
jgi:sporulation protein YhbH